MTRVGFEPNLASVKGWRPHQKSNGPILYRREDISLLDHCYVCLLTPTELPCGRIIFFRDWDDKS